MAALVAAAAGLLVLGTSTAAWSARGTTRDVGGVEIADVVTVAGADLRPALLVVGLALLAGAGLIALTRGALRRVCGGVVAATGGLGVAVAASGASAAASHGGLRAAAWLAVAGCALGVLAGGLALVRPLPARGLPDRFDIDPDPGPERAAGETDEWELAADDGERGR